jgi:hypothetical protein
MNHHSVRPVIDAHPQDRYPAERRCHPPKLCEQGVPQVTATAGLNRCLATVRDISPSGIGLWLPFSSEPDQRVTLELLNRSGNFLHLKLARVAHVTASPDGSWLVGYEFVYPFTADEFCFLLGPPEVAALANVPTPSGAPRHFLAVA